MYGSLHRVKPLPLNHSRVSQVLGHAIVSLLAHWGCCIFQLLVMMVGMFGSHCRFSMQLLVYVTLGCSPSCSWLYMFIILVASVGLPSLLMFMSRRFLLGIP